MIVKANESGVITKVEPDSITQIVNGYKTLTIVGGEFAIVPHEYNIAIKTLLGSCVSMMFFDKRLKTIAMNHFLLPEGTSNTSMKFGLNSVESMINEMYKMGSRKSDLVVKLAGGAHIIAAHDNRIGDKNIEFAQNFCKVEGFPIESQHVYDVHGRVVLLTSNFDTFIRIVKNKAIEAEITSHENNLATLPQEKVQESSGVTFF